MRKMTSLNAAKLGLADRGLLRPGNFADVTVFDPERVIDRATYTDPFQYSEGIEYVDRQRAGGARSRQAHRVAAGQGPAPRPLMEAR